MKNSAMRTGRGENEFEEAELRRSPQPNRLDNKAACSTTRPFCEEASTQSGLVGRKTSIWVGEVASLQRTGDWCRQLYCSPIYYYNKSSAYCTATTCPTSLPAQSSTSAASWSNPSPDALAKAPPPLRHPATPPASTTLPHQPSPSRAPATAQPRIPAPPSSHRYQHPPRPPSRGTAPSPPPAGRARRSPAHMGVCARHPSRRAAPPAAAPLLLALSLALSAATAAAAAAAADARAAAAATPRAQPYPRNLHRAYDGTWEIAGGGGGATPFSHVPRERPPVLAPRAGGEAEEAEEAAAAAAPRVNNASREAAAGAHGAPVGVGVAPRDEAGVGGWGGDGGDGGDGGAGVGGLGEVMALRVGVGGAGVGAGEAGEGEGAEAEVEAEALSVGKEERDAVVRETTDKTSFADPHREGRAHIGPRQKRAAAAAAAASTSTSASASTDDGLVVDADGTAYTSDLAFDNRAGFALLTAVNHESALGEDINIVFGELLIRDGPYRSAHDVSLRLMGVYQWASGKLLVVGDVLYEDTTSALQRLYKTFASNQLPTDLQALAERNVTEHTFVSALTPAFAKHRKQFHSPRAQGGSPTPSQSASAGTPQRPTVPGHCPFSAAISIVAGSFSDRLPTRPDISALPSFVSGSNDASTGGTRTTLFAKDTARSRLPPSSAAAGERLVETDQEPHQEQHPEKHQGSARAANGGEHASTFEDGSIDGQSELVEMNGVYTSEACKTQLNIILSTLDTEMLFGKAINYTLLVTFVAFLQVVVLIRQMEMTSTQAGASRVSLMTVGLQAVADSYLCLGHLTMGIAVPTLFNAFATAAFFKFIIFSIFEMRYLLLIWKARRPSGFAEGWEAMRRELSLLYSRFYGSLLFGIVVLYQLQNHLKYFLFALMAFWVPQIVLNVVGDHRKPLHPLYIFGMSATRMMIPLYFYACPRNFLHVQPQYSTAIALVGWVVFQAAILLSQHRYGSRWFVPRPLLPVKYDYFRPVSLDDALCSGGAGGGAAGSDDETAALAAEEGRVVLPGSVECVICMTPVEVDGRDRMVTPCDHFFHTECLCSWLEVKLECAVCRRPVPPP